MVETHSSFKFNAFCFLGPDLRVDSQFFFLRIYMRKARVKVIFSYSQY